MLNIIVRLKTNFDGIIGRVEWVAVSWERLRWRAVATVSQKLIPIVNCYKIVFAILVIFQIEFHELHNNGVIFIHLDVPETIFVLWIQTI